MTLRSLFNRQSLERIVFTRWFTILTFSLVFALLCLAGLNFKIAEALDNLENVLLDERLKLRANSLAPSDDIVIIAKDHNTDSYARENPELKLQGNALPRKRVAQVIEFAAREGARAIVLDTEFKVPTTPENDDALEKAIKKAGNVYLAITFDQQVSKDLPKNVPNLMEKVLLQKRMKAHQIDALLFYLPHQKYLNTWYPPTDFIQLKPPQSLMDYENPDFETVSDFLTEKINDPKTLNDFIRYKCLYYDYHNEYAWNPDFLTLMDQHALNVRETKPSDTSSYYQPMFCRNDFLLEPLFKATKGIGVVTIGYNDDAYIRDVSLLYQGYKGNYYTYLGVRPALDILNAHTLVYFPPETLRIQDKTIPLHGEQKAFINWRNPNILNARLKKKAQLLKLVQNFKTRELVELEQNCPGLNNYAERREALFLDRKNSSPENNLMLLSLFQHEMPRTKLDRSIGSPLNQFIQPDQTFEELQQEIIGSILSRIEYGDSEEKAVYMSQGKLYRHISAVDVILNMENREERENSTLYNIVGDPDSGKLSLKNKVVLYGEIIKDIHRTPAGNETYGPEIVATVIDMIWHDQKFIQKIFDWRIYSIVILFALGILYMVNSAKNRLVPGFIIGMLIITVYWVFNFAIFNFYALFFPLVLPTVILFFTLIAGTSYRYGVQDREKRQLTSVFSNYVSPQVMDEILKNPERAMENLKGRKKELTVLFADIKNFTSTFENEDPEQMVDQLREYFDTMNNIILKYDGTIDKYMGDAVMAFFGAPAPHINNAEIACQAALEMQSTLTTLNQKWTDEGKVTLEHGVGISTGMMVVGHFGSTKLQNYTVMGSMVNLGARLETYTREVDARIIINDKTYMAVKDKAATRDLGKIQVKGFSEPVQVYALDQWMPGTPGTP